MKSKKAIGSNLMLAAAFLSVVKCNLLNIENMSNVKVEINLPAYAVKHIETIRVLFAVNVDTKEVVSFVPMSMYLELLSKVEKLECKQAQNQLTDGTDG